MAGQKKVTMAGLGGDTVDLTTWFEPSDAVLHLVQDALRAEKKLARREATKRGGQRLPPILHLQSLVNDRAKIRSFIADALLQAIGVIMLREQRNEPREVTIGIGGQFSAELRTALAARIPAALGTDENFFGALYTDVLHSGVKQGRIIDLGRGRLIFAAGTVQLELTASRPSAPIKPVAARIRSSERLVP
jgi:hypothetical protein